MLATDALTVSEAVRVDLAASRGWPDDRVHAVHTGTAFPGKLPATVLREGSRRQLKISETSPLVLTVARLSHEKGIEILIHAAAIVHKTCPDVRFVVAGDGPFKGELEAQINAAWSSWKDFERMSMRCWPREICSSFLPT